MSLMTSHISGTDLPYGFLLSGAGILTEVYISCTGEGNNSLIFIFVGDIDSFP